MHSTSKIIRVYFMGTKKVLSLTEADRGRRT